MVEESDGQWYAVRCVFESGWPSEEPGVMYEERITLWRAESFDEAIELGEAEALEYAAALEEAPDVYLGLAQAYRLVDAPGEGAEVFSLVRRSDLEAGEYLDTFFDTGEERAQEQ